MKTTYFCLGVLVPFLLPLAAQTQEPVVSKDSVSVHTVERGNMPLRAQAAGSISSLQPPRAVVTLSERGGEPCKVGQGAMAQLARPDSPRPFSGKIVSSASGKCEIEFSDAFPAGVAAGEAVGALIQTGELRDVIFFARPADSKGNSEAFAFVIEPDNQFARRVSVRYGEISGPLIQIVSGLSPGDRVIVTDMSKWVASLRVRLQ